ncbi:MAG TPA: diguanylate cyclase [Steroidobacteraceae bacterium]|jgi:diguanylate cyclase (GGDEF)-like protein/PAS domain S-box-containing protein|nr:diguanylate cyclase [Steroidobacteraceae bacterium]
MSSVEPNLLKHLVESAPEGVALCEARGGDWPVVFVNPALEQLTGYSADQIVGRNLRFLQADDRDQEGVLKIKNALRDGDPCHALIRNYRRDGTMFWNEMRLVPIRADDGQITHFASFHREGATLRTDTREQRDPSMSTQTMMAYLRDDKLTGLLRRPYFEDLIKRDWGLAQRESRRLSFLVFDLDHFAAYRDVFGRQGADQSFRRIARVIGGCFRRASDLCGRFDEDQIAALTTGLDLSQAAKLADAVLARVRDLAIHHPRSSVLRYVTASAGVVSMVPPHDVPPERIYEAALKALKDAKELGRNRAVSRECD